MLSKKIGKIVHLLIGAAFVLPSFAQEPVAGQCLIEPFAKVELGTPVPGILSDVMVERGDVVQKNTVVAKIDSRAQSATVALAKSKAEFAKRTLQRNEELLKEDLLSNQEKDQMATESELAQLELEQALVTVELRSIRSPIDGVVVEKVRTRGEFVDEGAVLELAQINPLNVEVVVPVTYFGKVEAGMLATVFPEAPIGGSYQAKVVVVDKVIDPASGTFRVRLQMPNKEMKIPSGLRCDIKFPFEDNG